MSKLNSHIQKHLSPEFKALFELSKNGLVEETQSILQSHIRRARRKFKSGETDLLASKLESYGNSGRWFKVKSSELDENLFHNKTPTKTYLGEWISVEIECILPSKQAERSFISLIKKAGLRSAITIKNDSSINTDDSQIEHDGCSCEYDEDDDCTFECSCCSGECECELSESSERGREIVVTFRYGQWNTIEQVCSFLSNVGADVNKSCGLHVHFDFRHAKSSRLVSLMGHRIAKCVDPLKLLLPQSRRNNSYCRHKINTPTEDADRYAFVNLQAYKKYRTLEIRGHSGTTDAKKIINWIEILKVIMTSKNTKEITSVKSMVNRFKFSEDLIKYIWERRRKFKTKSEVLDDVNEDNSLQTAIGF